ncbi:P-loop NTPase family protein [Mycoplasma marinum]|uniref:Uncharacterized protein n=1 Tax=Mycoplasma marinum TaxID=1937190 RepID=A0A4R0XM28_9MOLU|nr:hypothetical protein [Mycoplasma marinum]TCG10482.1 hypothetical protein C4B24_04590 [Mycoplasma marinum]
MSKKRSIRIKINDSQQTRTLPLSYEIITNQENKMIFIYGHNGSGKTTFTSLMGQRNNGVKGFTKEIKMNGNDVTVHSNLSKKITTRTFYNKPTTRPTNDLKEHIAVFSKESFRFHILDSSVVFRRHRSKIRKYDWGIYNRFFNSLIFEKDIDLLSYYNSDFSIELEKGQEQILYNYLLSLKVEDGKTSEDASFIKSQAILLEETLNKLKIPKLSDLIPTNDYKKLNFWHEKLYFTFLSNKMENFYKHTLEKIPWSSLSFFPKNINSVKTFIIENYKESKNKMDISINKIFANLFPGKKPPRTFSDFDFDEKGVAISYSIYEESIRAFSEGEKVLFRVKILNEMNGDDIENSIIIFDDILDVTDRSIIVSIASDLKTFFKTNKKRDFAFLMTFHDYQKMLKFNNLLTRRPSNKANSNGKPCINLETRQIFDHEIFNLSRQQPLLETFNKGSGLVENSQLLLYRPLYDSLSKENQSTLCSFLKSNEFMHFNPNLKHSESAVNSAFQELFYIFSVNENKKSINFNKFDFPNEINHNTLKNMANTLFSTRKYEKTWNITLRKKFRDKEKWLSPINVFIIAWAIRFKIEEWICNNKRKNIATKTFLNKFTTRSKFELLPVDIKVKNKELILHWVELVNNELHDSGIGILDNTTSGLLIYRKLKHSNFSIKIER